jgi:hypothetical protein
LARRIAFHEIVFSISTFAPDARIGKSQLLNGIAKTRMMLKSLAHSPRQAKGLPSQNIPHCANGGTEYGILAS